MRDLQTLPADRLAIIVLADGRRVPGSWHLSSLKGFGRMYYGRLGEGSYIERLDCDGLTPVGWEAFPAGYDDPVSGQELAA